MEIFWYFALIQELNIDSQRPEVGVFEFYVWKNDHVFKYANQ